MVFLEEVDLMIREGNLIGMGRSHDELAAKLNPFNLISKFFYIFFSNLPGVVKCAIRGMPRKRPGYANNEVQIKTFCEEKKWRNKHLIGEQSRNVQNIKFL